MVSHALDVYEGKAPSPVVNDGARAVADAVSGGGDSGWSGKFKGEIRLAIGIESDGDSTMGRANQDLMETNWRWLSNDGLNNYENTYDPAIFSRLKLVFDSAVTSAISMHFDVTVDPWSYTGQTHRQMVTGVWGNDTAEVQYYYSGNTAYTVPRSIMTGPIGDGLSLPEIKVKDGKVPAMTLTSSYGDTFAVPEMKLDYNFQPLRELWFDVKPSDTVSFRLFPMAYHDQALTTDEPLRLSNNKSYWEESPWLRQWLPGSYHTTSSPAGFTRGEWDRSLSFYSKDSFGQYLTALRGVSLSIKPDENTSLEATVATPKHLWQDYGEATAVPGSVRLKHFLSDRMYLGGTANMHIGLNGGEVDAENYVGGVDTGLILAEGLELNAQVSSSTSSYDQTRPDYQTDLRGQAYYVSLEGSTAKNDMLRKDYHGLNAGEAEDLLKTKLYFGRMDENFDSSLSNYHETRDDSFWSRNMTFNPQIYRDMPGEAPTMSEDDRKPFAIGDGLDYGRKAMGWRVDSRQMEGRLEGLTDVRHVLTTDNDHIESVARTQWALQATEKLLTKVFVMWHGVPDTVEGMDPFIVSGDTGAPLPNNVVEGGKDADLKTGSFGLRYEVTEKVVWNGVWQYTNDFTVGDDHFPRGLFNGSSFTSYTQEGRDYWRDDPLLYSQGYFDQAPYAYHNILKTGLLLRPTDKWNIYLDYTRNPNKFAGPLNDNINHFGLETGFVPNKKIGFFAKYVYSRMYDIDRLGREGVLDYEDYHNMFFETRWMPTADSLLSVMYGVGPSYQVTSSAIDPVLGYALPPVLETEHLVRIVYQKKF
ncbi:MAG: hypothetical protein GX606_01720 [Elusimicrobia bacterium]|nr:hypothetical protein [Elusimicrobiota bacterium]